MSNNSPTKKEPFRFPVLLGLILVFLIGGATEYVWHKTHDAGPDSASIKQFLFRYFKTWSSKDMAGYAACFDPSAMIYFIKDGAVVLRQNKPDFIEGQGNVLQGSATSVEEHAEKVKIVAQGDVAYVRALWAMTKGSKVTRGYDHYVLLHTPQGWQILSLSFYEIP